MGVTLTSLTLPLFPPLFIVFATSRAGNLFGDRRQIGESAMLNDAGVPCFRCNFIAISVFAPIYGTGQKADLSH